MRGDLAEIGRPHFKAAGLPESARDNSRTNPQE